MNAGYFDQTDSKYLFLSLPSSYFRLRQILIRSILVKLTPSTYCLHQSIKCSLVVERSTLGLQKLVLDKSKIGEVKSARGHNRFSRYKGSHESSSPCRLSQVSALTVQIAEVMANNRFQFFGAFNFREYRYNRHFSSAYPTHSNTRHNRSSMWVTNCPIFL